MTGDKISYTAANSFPIKIFLNSELIKNILESKRILPYHIQLNPENRCTQNCSWCSCSNRNKKLRMDYETVIKVIDKFKSLGTKSCTITGGGEFLCHKDAKKIISKIYKSGIDIGLVTNGDLIYKLNRDDLNKIVWIRISLGDGKKLKKDYWSNLSKILNISSKVDYSFSYVIANKKFNYSLIKKMIEFANKFKFTHIRIVNDINNAKKLRVMEHLKRKLKIDKIDDSKVIYQNRGIWNKGTKNCWISLLKPVITADGKLGACCGEQYRTKNPTKDYIADWGTIKDIDKIWEGQKCYDGSKCYKCYYGNYNLLMDILLKEVKHKSFV